MLARVHGDTDHDEPEWLRVGAQVPIEATATAWKVDEDGEHVHIDLIGTNVIVDAQLEGAWGTKATRGQSFVGVARTIGADAPAMAAVSIAGAPHTPTTTRDELRVAVRCALSTDLQE